MSREAGENGGELSGSFALRKNDLGHSVAKGAVVVDVGESEVFKRQMAKTIESSIGGELFGADVFQKFEKCGAGHVGSRTL